MSIDRLRTQALTAQELDAMPVGTQITYRHDFSTGDVTRAKDAEGKWGRIDGSGAPATSKLLASALPTTLAGHLRVGYPVPEQAEPDDPIQPRPSTNEGASMTDLKQYESVAGVQATLNDASSEAGRFGTHSQTPVRVIEAGDLDADRRLSRFDIVSISADEDGVIIEIAKRPLAMASGALASKIAATAAASGPSRPARVEIDGVLHEVYAVEAPIPVDPGIVGPNARPMILKARRA